MCFFEKENGLFIFYGLFYLPLGSYSLEKLFLKSKNKIIQCETSSYISEVFGRNTFDFFDNWSSCPSRSIRLKFLDHLFTGERLIYSKGLPGLYHTVYLPDGELVTLNFHELSSNFSTFIGGDRV